MTGEKKEKKELLIIIPAYNEANNITKLLEKLESPEIAEIADVLIMNDASSDDTNWIVKARNHAIVTHVFNLGYGSALQLGYRLVEVPAVMHPRVEGKSMHSGLKPIMYMFRMMFSIVAVWIGIKLFKIDKEVSDDE